MNQPITLVLPVAYPGNAYSHTLSLPASQTEPALVARLRYGRGDRLVQPASLQPTAVLVNDMSNPTAWKARIELADTSDLPRRGYLELLVNGQVYAAGDFNANYQTTPL